ncbi:upstream-binding factor 1-like protein 1 [Pipistrellus kuhlii]|uniref:upstream-binding factor 1-like protein 1 n=1 Tax=Pipistrellus kuhlii TaxID=59472 RepID=UPI00174EFCAF|nr:upstream-binding factor 1-like protein 1 [Pipistrellus kuhlii]
MARKPWEDEGDYGLMWKERAAQKTGRHKCLQRLLKWPKLLEMALANGRDQWPKEDIVMLLDRLKNNLPSNDEHTFKTTQSRMDWGKVAFKGYSGEMCKLKWLDISRKIRKYRTLTELVLEAKEHVKNSKKSKRYKKHPDMPKQPLTSYMRFYKEKRPEYSQMHPKLNNQELTKVMSEKYKALPEEMKLKYMEDFQKEKQQFQEKLAQFRKDHPEPEQNSKTSVVSKGSRRSRAHKKFKRDEKELKSSQENDLWGDIRFRGEPEKPPMNAYHKFHQDVWSSEELQGLPPMQRMVEICRLWQRVPVDQRELYEQQAEELQKQYTVDLDKWLKTLSPEEYAAFRERSAGKRKIKMRRGPDPKIIKTEVQSPSARTLQEGLAQNQGPDPGMASSETNGDISHASRGSEGKKEHEEKAESSSSSDSCSSSSDSSSSSSDSSSSSSDSSSSNEDDSSCSSSSSGDTSDSDSN